MRYLSGVLACALMISACGTENVDPAPPTPEKAVEEAVLTPEVTPMGDWRDDLPDVVARVGDTAISRDTFLEEFTLARAAVEARAKAAGQELPPSFAFDEKAGLRLVQSLVDNELLEQYARAQGYDVSEEELAEALERGKGSFETEEAYLESLSRQKLTLEVVRARVARRLLIGKLIESRVAGLEADDARVKAEYQKLLGAGAFDVPESVTVSQIFVPLAEGEENTEAETLLQKAFDDLQKGAAFPAVANDVTQTLPEARSAEQLTLTRGPLDAVFENAAFNSPVGEWTSPFRSSSGWHVLTVTERRPARSLSFEEVRPRLEERVLFPEQEAAFVALVKEAMKDIPVELYWKPDGGQEVDAVATPEPAPSEEPGAEDAAAE
jgi:parvulin-like peptidyl-prolyl isomerase